MRYQTLCQTFSTKAMRSSAAVQSQNHRLFSRISQFIAIQLALSVIIATVPLVFSSLGRNADSDDGQKYRKSGVFVV